MVKNRVSRSGRRGRLLVAVLAVGAVLALFLWLSYGEGLRRTAGAGTAYGARVACSCRFVAGRSLDDCAKDKLAGMELVRFSEDTDSRSVTASVPLLASETATYRPGYGCMLQEWRD